MSFISKLFSFEKNPLDVHEKEQLLHMRYTGIEASMEQKKLIQTE
jgi:hypothetical protein